MKESERESIKLTASFLNSLAVVFAATGIIAPLYSILYQLDEGFDLKTLAVTVLVAVGAGLSSWDCHGTAKKFLLKLDEE